jgi:CheY-like chemotaxis protein
VAAALVVDDNATIRKAISMRLGSKGYDVVTAPDGKKALRLIETSLLTSYYLT